MKDSGQLKGFNRAFKAARKAATSLRYHDYLHAHKAGVLEKLAKHGR